ncbi:hypothetical protein [Allorhodopirellula solitaria]|uniref:Uncharacterized protein n=1 Tax=Allorhodopirellula solitaria TaxID=2527987 RepID=A0A5C5YJD9_9BACT|nr:hypothetical protein [Allorhodopirellula solitaria]TWT74992.1 hypothetical protein CA85_02800 [Allorhodopirellula solitaria]
MTDSATETMPRAVPTPAGTERAGPAASEKRPPPASPPLQIGIASLLVMVIVAAVISAGLVYAARIPEVQEEWSVLFGTPVTADRSRRGPQILFILFTVTSPLLIAVTLSLATSCWAYVSKR